MRGHLARAESQKVVGMGRKAVVTQMGTVKRIVRNRAG